VTHILFDSWLHERDVFLPLGTQPPLEDDELLTVLTYALLMVGTFQRPPFEEVVRGVRISVDDAKVRSVPVAPVLDETSAATVDALTGRGDLGSILTGADAATFRALGSLGRFLSSA
jgi:hypothetical protein